MFTMVTLVNKVGQEVFQQLQYITTAIVHNVKSGTCMLAGRRQTCRPSAEQLGVRYVYGMDNAHFSRCVHINSVQECTLHFCEIHVDGGDFKLLQGVHLGPLLFLRVVSIYVYTFCGKTKKDKVCYPPAHLPSNGIGLYIFYMTYVVVAGDESLLIGTFHGPHTHGGPVRCTW